MPKDPVSEQISQIRNPSQNYSNGNSRVGTKTERNDLETKRIDVLQTPSQKEIPLIKQGGFDPNKFKILTKDQHFGEESLATNCYSDHSVQSLVFSIINVITRKQLTMLTK
jgi:hypothetical protein